MPLSSRRTTWRNKSGIALLVRRLGAVALGVGHCPADHDTGRLRPLEKSEKALVIFAAVLAVDIERHRMAAADGVKPDAALKASAGAAAKLALHLMLGDQFAGAHRHVEEAVDPAITDTGMHRRKIRLLGCKPIGFRHGIDRRPDHRMIHRFRHALSHEEHIHAAAAQRIDVILRGPDRGSEIGPQCLDGFDLILHRRPRTNAVMASQPVYHQRACGVFPASTACIHARSILWPLRITAADPPRRLSRSFTSAASAAAPAPSAQLCVAL